ncbi:SRPBCC family protein [Salinispora pacifica]|uniref:SRPBCC family protein n=1 Tax=Salinispora pacifica TaxID=351187 RepID=UPI0003789F4E|nr:SRPBCC domain-containing protein [Salinispora pacifica]
MSDLLVHRVRVPAPVARVRQVLTDPGALRVWLAEHVDVRLPERFEFWGRFTPEGDAPHQRLLHVDDHSLRFEWRLDDTDTTVEFGLAEDGSDATVLTVTQTDLPNFEEMVAEVGTLSRVHTFWALSIANLVEYVEGRELTPKCDFTSTEMRAEVLLDAPPDEVFDSLVEPAQFARWFGARVELEPEVGGRWAMGGYEADPTPAQIIDLEPAARLSLAWDNGLVTSWELADSEGQTRLTIVQSGFAADDPPYSAWMGWLGGIAELRRYHGLSCWQPMWLEVRLNNAPEGILTIG